MADSDSSTSPSKTCKWCGETKSINRFPKAKTCRDGRGNKCYACVHEARSANSRAAERRRIKTWKAENGERWRETKRQQGIRARRLVGVRSLEQVQAEARQKEAQQEAQRKAAKLERERFRAERPWLAPGLTAAQRWTIRYQSDPIFNLRERIRTALRHERAGIKLGELLRGAIRRNGKSPSATRLLGYTVEALKLHLERQFDPTMSWAAFLRGEIHIDHVRPLALFDLTDATELRAAWALPNLRPMWEADNISKGAKAVLLL